MTAEASDSADTNDYVRARATAASSSSPDGRAVVVVWVDDRPYLPFLEVSAEDPDTCKKAVAAVLDPALQPRGDATTTTTLPAGWESLEVRPVSGGNTNLLFCVSNLSVLLNGGGKNLPDKVLLRVFGGEGLIDRDEETTTYAALARDGLALPYHGRFSNGRIEGWSSWECLADPRVAVPEISVRIAEAMGRLHAWEPPASTVPPPTDDDPERRITMWIQLNEWMEKALSSSDGDSTTTTMNEHDLARRDALGVPSWKDELEFLQREVVDPRTSASPVGFCHNDVLAANIMWDPLHKQLQLIDFEYGGTNYLLYDIANHFNEFCGGTDTPEATPDYSKFPSRQLQRDFVAAYQTAYRRASTGREEDEEAEDAAAIEAALAEIEGFVLANHMVWSLWAVNQAATEGCAAFDYLNYAKCRMDRYQDDKREWLLLRRQQ